MDSRNPYEPSNASPPEESDDRPTWPRAIFVAGGYLLGAVFLFGFLPPYLKMREASPSSPLTFENLWHYAEDKFFVVSWLAIPLAIGAAFLDFLPRKRLGVLRSFAISGGIMLSIFIATILAMFIVDENYRDTFVRYRNSYDQHPTLACWIGLGLGQLGWLAAMAAILRRRLRQTAS